VCAVALLGCCRRRICTLVLLGIGLLFSALLWAARVAGRPTVLVTATVLLLVLLLGYWVVALALTAVMKVGSDG
jgi:hypothetical protein